MDSSEFQAHAGQIEKLVEQANSLADEDARATALELMQSLMDLHGAAVARIVELLGDCGEGGRKALGKLGEDPLVCGLLVLYGVHPLPLQDRVRGGLERLQAPLRKQGGSAELIGIAGESVRIKVSRKEGHGSPDGLRATVEQAVREAAPELAEVLIEGLPPSGSGFVPLSMLQSARKEESNYEESTVGH